MISHKLALLLLFVSYTYAEDKICNEDKDCQPNESCVDYNIRPGSGYPFSRKYCRNTKKCWTDEQCDEGQKCIRTSIGFGLFGLRCVIGEPKESGETKVPETPKELGESKETTCDEDKDCQPGESCVIGIKQKGQERFLGIVLRKYCRKVPKRWCRWNEHCDEGEKCILTRTGFGLRPQGRCEKDESEEPEEPKESKETIEVKERKPCGDGSSCDWDEECASGCAHWPPRPTWPPPPCCKKIFPPPTEEPKEQKQPTKKCYGNSDCPQGTECRGAEDCSHACSIGLGCIPIACFPRQG